jgi:hypothetical protein
MSLNLLTNWRRQSKPPAVSIVGSCEDVNSIRIWLSTLSWSYDWLSFLLFCFFFSCDELRPLKQSPFKSGAEKNVPKYEIRGDWIELCKETSYNLYLSLKFVDVHDDTERVM